MRFAIVGCGSRHRMYRDALMGPYADLHDLVALCDSNAIRLEDAVKALPGPVSAYPAKAYAQMLAEIRPDCVIVCTPDATHADYIVTALEAGSDVICEKPLATSPEQIARILDAQSRTGRKVTVTFNYRYAPSRTQLKTLLEDGVIGRVTAVNLRWHLDRVHGADYFRRWHRKKDNSGGLLVHKSSHHFDLLNWWLSSVPREVSASAQRHYYTPDQALALGLQNPGPRCATCAEVANCAFALELEKDEALRKMYREAESADGYFRDQCIFDPEVEIEDTYQALIRYRSGASCTYSLVAYAPWEGLDVTFYGTEGELSHRHVEVHGIFGGTRPEGEEESMQTLLHRAGHAPEVLTVDAGVGDHGGADPLILKDLFDPSASEDPHGRAADHRAGALSIATGLAAEQAIREGGIVTLNGPDPMADHTLGKNRSCFYWVIQRGKGLGASIQGSRGP